MMANLKSKIPNTVCAVGLLLRLAPLGRYVTPDEPAWVYRAIRFADALSARDWAAVPSTGHPGVTTMWLGTLGVTIRRLVNPVESGAHLDWIRHLAWLAPENGEAFRHLAFFLPWGRVAVALVTTLGLLLLYPMLKRLFDRRVALLTVGLLAFDPFLVGHSGLLHVDALLATFSLLALVAGLNGLWGPRRAIWWALSGLFTGLAVLTKTPGVVVALFLIAVITFHALRFTYYVLRVALRPFGSASGGACCVKQLASIPLFLAAVALAIFVLYPALWADPAGTFHTLFAFAGRHIETVQRPVFFAGQMTYDPGPAFYPIVLLFRVSPVTPLGLIVGLITLRRLPPERRLAFLLLLAFAAGFGALMSLGVKKHDRYLLPVFPPLTLAAALGWEYLSRRVMSRRVIPLLLVQLVIALAFAPYPLTAFNLLAGGPWGAARVLPVDWGEGVGAAARWLNRLPGADRLTVATDSVPSFASLFSGRTVPINRASLSDYLVTSRPPDYPTTRPLDHPTTRLPDYLTTAIYTNTAPFEQAAYLAGRVGLDDAILLDADTPLPRHYTGPGAIVSVADLPDQATVAARVAELSAGRSILWLVADPAASPITAAHLHRGLDAVATPVFTATVGPATLTQYAIRATQHVTRNTQHATRAAFGNSLILIDAILPTAPVNTSCPVYLRWQAPAPTPPDLHASLHLRDSADRLWAEVGQPVLNDVTFPTSAWAPGEWADNTLTLKLPQRIPPATYALQLILTDPEGAQLGAWDAGGAFQGVRVSLGDVEIAPPAEPAGPAVCAEGRTLTAGPFLLCVPAVRPPAIPSGDQLTFALTWSATAPPGEDGGGDHSVRFRLIDSTGSVALEQTTALSPYATSRWRAGDSFEVWYDLRLDPLLPAAAYTLALNVIAPDGSPLWATDEPLTTVEILPRDRLFELPGDIGYSLDLTLGDFVHLRGFDLDRAQAAPGDALPLTLYWQGDGPTDLDYTVFVHLLGPDGRPHGQVDRSPGGGAAPTTSWAPGQVIVDVLSIPVADDAPAGDYRIAVGMYDGASGGRLPVTDASGNPLPDDRAILPIAVTVAGGNQ